MYTSAYFLQILEQKVAAAEGEKAEFEEETLKWEKERADLLTQLQNCQTQYQVFTILSLSFFLLELKYFCFQNDLC